MKLLLFDNNRRVHVISDSAIARNGQPWFIPDFGESWKWRSALAVKISRLGKGVSIKHVGRYADEVTLLWVAEAENCQALDYMDGRVVVGTWLPIVDDLNCDLANAIVEASKYATLKNGDIIAVPFSDELNEILPNSSMQLSLNNQTVIKFNIK